MAEKYFSDDPIENADQDQLGRVAFSRQVAKVCNQVAGQSKTTVLALIGPWGSGKSSVLELVTGELGSDQAKWKVVRFNPWLFSDIESLLTNFFGELGAVLPKDRRGKAARKLIGEYVQKVSPLGKLGALAGVDLSGIAQRGGEWLKGEASTEARRAEIEKLLAELEHKILVVVDDLDRLQPVELLQIFKLIRLVGRFPNVHYLLAYDERTILDLLGRSDLAYGDEKRAQDYIQKIVQVRLDLPPMHDDQQAELVDSGLKHFFMTNQVTVPDSELRRFGWMYHSSLKGYLSEPRAINRFMAQLHALYPLIHGEINVIDFLALTFLRTFEPNLYKVLSKHREVLTGSRVGFLFGNAQSEDKEAVWLKIVAQCGVAESDRDEMMSLLKGLFPKALTGQSGESDRRQKPVDSPDYFDRYFQFGVPATDLSDAAVARALSLLPDFNNSEVKAMVAQFQSKPSRLLRKIKCLYEEGLVENPEQVFALLSYAYKYLPSRSGFTDAPDLLLMRIADVILTALDHRRASELVVQAAKLDGSAVFAADLTRRALKDGSESKDWRQWAADCRESVISIAEEHIKSWGAIEVEELGKRFGLLYRLYWLCDDAERVQRLVWENISEGRWTAISVLAQLVAEGTSSGGRRTIFGLDPSTVEVFLGIDRAIEHLGADLDGEPDPADLDEEVEATKENKERYALASMKVQKRKKEQDSVS